MEPPGISILMPTLNAERYIEGCLQSIRAQDYPQDKIEILIADGGSTDRTLTIAEKYQVDSVVPNPGVTTEAGLAILNALATKELLAYIDADNYLIGDDWLTRMTQPFDDEQIFASEPIRWHYDAKDYPINRYFALAGINDPVSLFLGNYARHSTLTNKWTEMPHDEEARRGYTVVGLRSGQVPILGHNGFIARTDVIRKVSNKDFYFDVDAIGDLVRMGFTTIAKVDVGIGHHFSRNVRAFTRKTRRRIEDFLYYRSKRTYPWLQLSKARYLKFVVYTVAVFPLLLQSLKGFKRTRDWAWFYHLPVCWITLIFYGIGVMKWTIKKTPYSRDRYKY